MSEMPSFDADMQTILDQATAGFDKTLLLSKYNTSCLLLINEWISTDHIHPYCAYQVYDLANLLLQSVDQTNLTNELSRIYGLVDATVDDLYDTGSVPQRRHDPRSQDIAMYDERQDDVITIDGIFIDVWMFTPLTTNVWMKQAIKSVLDIVSANIADDGVTAISSMIDCTAAVSTEMFSVSTQTIPTNYPSIFYDPTTPEGPWTDGTYVYNVVHPFLGVLLLDGVDGAAHVSDLVSTTEADMTEATSALDEQKTMLASVVGDLSNTINNGTRDALFDIQQWINKLTAVSNILDQITKFAIPTVPALAGMCDVFIKALQMISELCNNIVNFIKVVIGAIALLVAWIAQNIAKGIKAVMNYIKSVMDKVRDYIKALMDDVAGFFSFLKAWKDKLQEFLEMLAHLITQIVNPCGLHLSLTNLLPQLAVFAPVKVSQAVNAISDIHNEMGHSVNKMTNDVMAKVVEKTHGLVPVGSANTALLNSMNKLRARTSITRL